MKVIILKTVKYFLITFLIIMIASSFAGVFASDDKTINVEGTEFNIPDGYKFNKTENLNTNLKNDEGDYIKISVNTAKTNSTISGVIRTIKGKKGIVENIKLGDNGNVDYQNGKDYRRFIYNEGHGEVLITARNLDLIEEVIK